MSVVVRGILILALGVALLAVPPIRGIVAEVSALLTTSDLDPLRNYLRGYGPWAPAASVGLMLLQSLLVPLPAFPIIYANGLLFGALWGGLLSWGSAQAAAAACFGLAHWLGRPAVERLVSRPALDWCDRFLARYGPYAVFLARLTPVVSFDLVSYAAGLTPMSFWAFAVATAFGAAPAIFLYAALGDAGLWSPSGLLPALGAVALLTLLGFLLRRRHPGDRRGPESRRS